MSKAAQSNLIIGLASLFLALSCISFGYAFCAFVPAVTETAANATVDDSASPFSKEDLVKGAMATREYSFGDHDQDAFYQTIGEMNADVGTSPEDTSADSLKELPQQYTVNEEALSHLDEVYDIASNSIFPILGIAAIAAFLMMAGLRMFGERVLARSLFWGGAAVLIIIAVLGIWAIVSFDSLFAVFHSLLFPNGGWTFPANSLLITMLPESFWETMALVWLGCSALLAVLCLIAGLLMTRRLKQAKDSAEQNHSTSIG